MENVVGPGGDDDAPAAKRRKTAAAAIDPIHDDEGDGNKGRRAGAGKGRAGNKRGPKGNAVAASAAGSQRAPRPSSPLSDSSNRNENAASSTRPTGRRLTASDIGETDDGLAAMGLRPIDGSDQPAPPPDNSRVLMLTGPAGEPVPAATVDLNLSSSSSASADQHMGSYDRLARVAGDDIIQHFRRPSDLVGGSAAAKASAHTPRTDPFKKMSDEVVMQILKVLPKATLSRLAQVSRRFRVLCTDEALWRRVDVGDRAVGPGILGIVVFSRGAHKLRAARTNFASPAFATALTPEAAMVTEACKLTALDLSAASISPGDLTKLLACCRRLKKLSLENVAVTEEALTEGVALNQQLDTLHLGMATGVTTRGLMSVLQGCARSLRELNLSWTDLSAESLNEACLHGWPASLQRLNLSGCRETLTDEHVRLLCNRCPDLLEIDLSDAVQLTADSMVMVCRGLRKLQSLSTSRCYSIAPTAYLSLDVLSPSLQYLNLFGVLKDNSLAELRQHLSPKIIVNKFLFSSVARPTFGIRRSSIWGMRVRD